MASPDGVTASSAGGSANTFKSAVEDLERRALGGVLVTRDDLDTLLQHEDLGDIEVHCFAAGVRAPHSHTMSISKFREKQETKNGTLLTDVVKRHRSQGETASRLKDIQDRKRTGDETVYSKGSPNYTLFLTSARQLSPEFAADLLDRLLVVCEIIRRCSINYQNIRRYAVFNSAAVDQASRRKEHGSEGIFSSKTQFVSELGKALHCSAKSFDVDLDSPRLSQILEFAREECSKFGVQPNVDMVADITRLVKQCIKTGLPMALTLGGSDDPIILLLFRLRPARILLG
jgi:hypothetical protein